MHRFKFISALLLAMLLVPGICFAEGHFQLPNDLSIIWVVPFVCMLLSIAICPLVVPHFWEHHFGKVALFWGLAFLVPCAMVFRSACMPAPPPESEPAIVRTFGI